MEHRGERAALHCMTNRIALYGKTLGHIKPLKERVRLAKSADEIREALESWLTPATSECVDSGVLALATRDNFGHAEDG